LTLLIVTACSTSPKTEQTEIKSLQEKEAHNTTQSFILASSNSDFCLQSEDTGDYKISVQDKVKISILNEQNLSGTFTVDNNGKVTMPLIGDVGIQGCTASQARQIIKDRYADGYLVNPNISLEMDSYKPIYIIGEVREPGQFDYVPNMNVLKAVALAGGYTYRANKKSIQILRKKPNGVTYQDDYGSNASIMPGDIITIKERLF